MHDEFLSAGIPAGASCGKHGMRCLKLHVMHQGAKCGHQFIGPAEPRSSSNTCMIVMLLQGMACSLSWLQKTEATGTQAQQNISQQSPSVQTQESPCRVLLGNQIQPLGLLRKHLLLCLLARPQAGTTQRAVCLCPWQSHTMPQPRALSLLGSLQSSPPRRYRAPAQLKHPCLTALRLLGACLCRLQPGLPLQSLPAAHLSACLLGQVGAVVRARPCNLQAVQLSGRLSSRQSSSSSSRPSPQHLRSKQGAPVLSSRLRQPLVAH